MCFQIADPKRISSRPRQKYEDTTWSLTKVNSCGFVLVSQMTWLQSGLGLGLQFPFSWSFLLVWEQWLCSGTWLGQCICKSTWHSSKSNQLGIHPNFKLQALFDKHRKHHTQQTNRHVKSLNYSGKKKHKSSFCFRKQRNPGVQHSRSGPEGDDNAGFESITMHPTSTGPATCRNSDNYLEPKAAAVSDVHVSSNRQAECGMKRVSEMSENAWIFPEPYQPRLMIENDVEYEAIKYGDERAGDSRMVQNTSSYAEPYQHTTSRPSEPEYLEIKNWSNLEKEMFLQFCCFQLNLKWTSFQQNPLCFSCFDHVFYSEMFCTFAAVIVSHF